MLAASKNLKDLFESLLIAFLVCAICHAIFYIFAPQFWAMNPALPQMDYTPYMRPFVALTDGFEMPVIYGLTFLCISFALFLSKITNLTTRIPLLTSVLILFSVVYFYKFIGLTAPMSYGDFIAPTNYLIILATITIGTFFLIRLQKASLRLFWLTIAVFLFPLCFIAITPLIWEDASFIFNPALKLIEGKSFSSFYMPYDYFLSLLAASWIKLNFSPEQFRLIAQFSLYALILVIVFFSQSLFKKKDFAVYLLISLIICKIYANLADPTAHLQVTPLRLDLWIILILLVFIKGPYHTTLGITFGVLIFFHHALGIIYFICYCQFIFVLAILDIDHFLKTTPHFYSAITNWIKKHFQLNIINFLIIAIFIVSYNILLKNPDRLDYFLLMKYRLISLPIAKTSFYWYILILFTAFSVLIMKCKEIISQRHYHTCIFLLLLSIGQSIYFYGRSHENAILNLAAIYLLCFFTFLDLMERYLQNDPSNQSPVIKKLPSLIAIIFLFGVVHSYSTKIINKTTVQFFHFRNSIVVDPENPMASDLKLIKQITEGSPKVYFMLADDFQYYYYGHYSPAGFFTNYSSTILKRTSLELINKLIHEDYIIVSKLNENGLKEMLAGLKFNHLYQKGYYIFLSNRLLTVDEN